MQDARRTQGPAAASYPKHNFTASPQYLPPPKRRPVALLSAKDGVGVPDRRTRREQAQTAVWTGAWQCLRLPKTTAPLSAPVLPPKSCTTSRQGSVRPSPRLISHLWSRKHPHRRQAPQLWPACSSDVQHRRAGCSLPGTELCIPSTVQVYGDAQRMHASASPPSSVMKS